MNRRKDGTSRRTVLKSIAGGLLASTLPAPAVLAQSKAPLKIGLLNSYTGIFSVLADNQLKGMQLYFDRIGWNIAGRRVELLQEDDQANPQVGLQKVKKMVESDNVDIVCGPQASHVAMALMNYIKESKTFLVVSGAGADAITWERIPFMFRTSISSWQLAHPMAEWIYDNLAKELVMSGTDFAAGRDVLRIVKNSFTAKGGKILKEMFPPLGTTDFSPYLTDMMTTPAPASFNFYAGADAVRFVQQYEQFGLKRKMALTGFSALLDATTLPAQGKAALGGRIPTNYADTLDNPENKSFVAEYRDKFKAFPSLYSDYGFVAAQVLDLSLRATDGDASDKQRLADAMAKVSFKAPRGPFRFDPVTHNVIHNVYITEIAEIEGRLTNKVIATLPDIKDPGVKPS
jgi:branched-chain amino acid transport system substrate-binding protein